MNKYIKYTYMVYVNCEIDYGGQTFSILYIKMYNLVGTLKSAVVINSENL